MDGTAMRVVVRIPIGALRGAQGSEQDSACVTRCLLLIGERADDHAHETAVQNGFLIASADVLGVLEEFLQQIPTDGHVAHLAAAELHDNTDLIARGQKLLGLIELRLVVVRVDTTGKLNLLDLNDLLLLLGFLLSLLLLEAELTVVHDLAHGGCGLGGDHDQIQLFLIRELEGFLGAHDSEGLSVCGDDPDLLEVDLLVQECLGFFSIRGDRYTPPK